VLQEGLELAALGRPLDQDNRSREQQRPYAGGFDELQDLELLAEASVTGLGLADSRAARTGYHPGDSLQVARFLERNQIGIVGDDDVLSRSPEMTDQPPLDGGRVPVR
jgi:hypothetical protein